MSINQPQAVKITYAEYLTWPDEPRYEIIDGHPYLQAAPSRQHQQIVTRLTGELYQCLKEKTCDVYTAPFDVRLSAAQNEQEYQVVQPNICVICDEKKLDDKGCKGAPDLIIEVLSPATWQRDRIDKLNLYQKYQVKEYLLIYPHEKIVEQYILQENNTYGIPRIYTEKEVFRSSTITELAVPLSNVFS